MNLPRLFVIGDSISMQYGPYLEAFLRGRWGYARRGGEELAFRNLDLPQGANNGDSSMVLTYLRGWQSQGGLPADLLLLNCGLHDVKTDPATGDKQVPIEQYRINLVAIVELLAALRLPTAWVRTTPCDELIHNRRPNLAFHRFAADVDAYNQVADSIMAAAAIPTIDLHGFTLACGDDLYCDHVHFQAPVRRLQAAFLAGWVCRHGLERPAKGA